MKTLFRFSCWMLGMGLLLSSPTFAQLKGAWQQKSDDGTLTSLICSDAYLMLTRYKEKEFI